MDAWDEIGGMCGIVKQGVKSALYYEGVVWYGKQH